MTLEAVVSRLEGVRRSGDGFTARCPAHDDRQNSLSAGSGYNERILLRCHAGCAVEQVVAALGIQMSDLTPENGRRRSSSAPSKTWKIRDTAGRVVAAHHRVDLPGGKKKIWWTRPDGVRGLGRLPTSNLPLYGAELVKDIPPEAEIYVTEGEKAADALRERGLLAVGTVTGAAGTPGPASLSVLSGRNVILWPDFDQVGREHMERISAVVSGIASRVRFLRWGEHPGDDAADHFARGGTVEGLVSLVAEEKKPSAGERPAEVLDAIAAFIRRFVVLSQAQAEILVLWILHTHTFQAVPETPYIWVSSPEKESGKTRLLEVCEMLVARPWFTGRTTAAALVRKIDRDKPTLLLDESDSAFSAEKEYAEALRGILDTGHREDGRSSVCVGQGASIDVRDFSTYCPKAIAGIGKGLPDTVISRSIPIRLRRQSRAERVERFRRRKAKREAAPLRDSIERWAAASLESLRGAEPSMPEGLRDRQEDGGECLIAIADLAAGDWPERARHALVEICRGAADDDSNGVRLLRDCRAVFDARGGVDRLPSADLCGALVDLEEGPWGELNKGRPLTTRSLARMLNPYGIVPGSIRMDDGRTPKGYHRDAFADAWERYCPSASTPSPSATTPQANTDAGFLDFSKRHTGEPVADEKREIANTDGLCGVVADKKPQDKEGEEVGAEEATPEEEREPGNAGREALL